MSEKKIVICDIDGTIANNDHRQHFLEGKKDWDGFFSSLSEDKPIFEIINKINNLNFKGHKITFLTGRPEKYRGETKKWLNRFFSFKYSIMRWIRFFWREIGILIITFFFFLKYSSN